MLFDPFEEQFNFPALVIDLCDAGRGDLEVICQEDESLVDLLGIEVDASE